MAETENHFTVFIRLPFNRGDFIDPPPVAWSAAKESALWNIISRQAKGNEPDWRALSEQFEVSQSFLLQQAAWLYERQLSQVRAQMRRVGSRQSATPSPIPGSATASMVGGQAMKRAGSGGSRVPSRLSTQALGSPVIASGDSTPNTPANKRSSMTFRSTSGASTALPIQTRGVQGTSRPISQQSSKDEAPTHAAQPRRGSIQHQLARSPGQTRNPQPQSSDSEDEMTRSRIQARRLNPSSIHRRALSQRQSLRGNVSTSTDSTAQQIQHTHHDDDDDEDEPSFLPFAQPGSTSSSARQDPGATIRPSLNTQQPQPGGQSSRPNIPRRTTSERIVSPNVEPPTPVGVRSERAQDLTSSTSSLSPPTHPSRPSSNNNNPSNPAQTNSSGSNVPRLTNPLSPTHRALLQSSPRRHTGAGSDTSPSMGSSFSDLDDASVTQSALEEALLSGMGNTTMTMPGGGVAGRVSGISQALRSRYFDARGEGQGQNQGQRGGVSER
ncbi:hypothetical protein EDD37DRAFT_7048 [Exophiala viscosa]|uniref:Autophagy-related protein 29 n=1 Tax=Exophiala viscosa TaxID=2486360 RepID=A0AAN6DLV8_9EURO|nr:hypothetical protein EDD36DRAFT_112198 [Exophiala viscosa]KAI1628460.1 hypothetical protein EDD37DRAFT_7048 [Exophiala viscosa]